MFLDEVRLVFRAGNGGDGVVSWYRAKYIPKGGPYGGDGGWGGDIVLLANPNLNTLSDFRHKKIIKAEIGERGYTKTMHGKDAEALVIGVPVGTIVKDGKTKEILADLSVPHTQFVLCKGGR